MKPTEPTSDPITAPGWVREVIDGLEAEPARETETGLGASFRAAFDGREKVSKEEREAWWCEVAAFWFLPARSGKSWPSNTHFGPQSSFTRGDGSVVHVPDIGEVNARVIAYWEARASSSKNPVARARYSDLVWDLKRKVLGIKPDVRFSRIAIDSYRESAVTYRSPDASSAVERIQWLERALQLSKQIHDRRRTESIRDEMFDLFCTTAQPEKIGTWDFIVRNCMEDRNVGLKTEQTSRVITFLEKGLALAGDIEQTKTFSPWAARAIAERLARYHQKEGRLGEAKRVTRAAGAAFENMAAKANPLQATVWLQDQHDTYRSKGMEEEAARVRAGLKDAGTKAISEMPRLFAPVAISAEELKRFGAQVTEGDLGEILKRISGRFTPSVALVRKYVETMGSVAPLASRISVGTMADGQFVARTGSVEDDPEGRLRLEVIRIAAIETPWLRAATDALLDVTRPSVEQLRDFVLASQLAEPERADLIMHGLRAYVGGDHVTAVHVLIPQIEHMFRVLLRIQGASTSKAGRSEGTMLEMNWNDILASSLIKAKMPEDLRLYLVSCFADPRGPNTRNRMSHGLMLSADFNRITADRVFHALIAIASWFQGSA